jgi:hypothetical protein
MTFSTIYGRLVIDSFGGVSTSGRPSDDRRTLGFFFHALDFADLVRGLVVDGKTWKLLDR